MAQADWGYVVGSLTDVDTEFGTTDQQGNFPPGGGNHIFGLRSKTSKTGSVAQYFNKSNFNPIVGKGARVSGAMIRWPNALGDVGLTGWSSFLFCCLQSDSLDAECYMFGLSDESPSRLVLRRGLLSEGIKSSVVGVDGVLARSDATFLENTWVQGRLDVVVNLNNDVRIFVKQNADLDANNVDQMVWTDVAGMAAVFEDAFGLTSESAGLVGGFVGFGYEQRGVDRVSFFDHMEVARGA